MEMWWNHNLVCGDAVEVWKRFDRCGRFTCSYALRRCSHKGGLPIASRAFCYPWNVGNAVPPMLMA